MAIVNVAPMHESYRKIPPLYRPGHPPIFASPPTKKDRALAKALLAELDAESQAWYRGDRGQARAAVRTARGRAGRSE